MRIFQSMLAETPKDHAAVNFRKWIDDPKNAHIVTGGHSQRAEVYGLTVAALQAFFRGLTGRSLKAVSAADDPFPLPEEE